LESATTELYDAIEILRSKELETTGKTSQDKVQALQDELNALQDELNASKAFNTEQVAKSKAFAEQNAMLQAEVRELGGIRDAERTRHDEEEARLRDRIEILRAKCKAAKGQLKKSDAEKAKLRFDAETLRAQLEQKIGEAVQPYVLAVKAKFDEAERLRAEIARLSAILEEPNSEVGTLMATNRRLDEELRQLRYSKIGTLTAEVNKQKATIKWLNEKLEQLTAKTKGKKKK
jgi:chromosome segregation ATPase